MSDVDPVVSIMGAERDQLLKHLLKMRDTMAAEGHRHVAAWANDRLIELIDERDRQAAQFAEVVRGL